MAAGRGAAGVSTGIIMGGFLCLGLVLFAIAATIVLSLIGIYTSNSSQQGYGEQYQINALFLKLIHGNGTYYFKNGSVASSTAFSTLCSSVYKTRGAAYFSACVLDNFFAVGPYSASNSSARRRRAVGDNGTMILGRARVYFSTTCSSKNDRLKYGNSSSLSKCASDRLAACNALFNVSGTTGTDWTPLPNPFSLSIVDSVSSSYVALTISRVLGFPTNLMLTIASQLRTIYGTSAVSDNVISNLNVGCQYIGPISQADIAAAVAGQATETTTSPATTVISG